MFQRNDRFPFFITLYCSGYALVYRKGGFLGFDGLGAFGLELKMKKVEIFYLICRKGKFYVREVMGQRKKTKGFFILESNPNAPLHKKFWPLYPLVAVKVMRFIM